MAKKEMSYLDFDRYRQTFTVNDICKRGVLPITRNKLYKLLREWGYIKSNNQPTDEMVQRGYMTEQLVKVPSYISRYETTHVPLFTRKGLAYLIDEFEKRFPEL
jgi:phage antirepressor YoqD-like protein